MHSRKSPTLLQGFSVKRGPTGEETAAHCPCDQALLSAVSPPCVRPGSYWGIRPLYFPLPATADGRHEIERFVWYLNSVVPLTGALEVSFVGLPNSLRKKFATAPLSGAACYSFGVSQTKWPARHGRGTKRITCTHSLIALTANA